MITPRDKVEATARPWRLISITFDDPRFIIWGPRGPGYGAICRTWRQGLTPTDEEAGEAAANAELIVTAVNERDSLLERVRVLEGALHPIVSCYGLGQPAEKFTEQVGPLVLDARAALAAKGE
jgi:hypothetical protein